MQEVAYRKLRKEDVGFFIKMRIHQLKEEGAQKTIDLEPYLAEYYEKHLTDGTFVSWLALQDRKIIATSGISFVEKPPYYSNPTGKIGLLSSMYTLKEYRRKGIAGTLLEKIVAEARSSGCGMIQITASDMGVLLYSNFGFQKNGNFMQYVLHK